MASSRAARSRASRLSWLARLGVTAGAIAATTALPLAAGSAQAKPVAHSGPPLGLAITSISQPFATPGETLTISGRLKNRTDHLLSGLTVRLAGSSNPITLETSLESFANGKLSLTQAPVAGVTPGKVSKLIRGQSRSWKLQVPVKDLNLSCFGVYPLTVEVSDATGAAQTSEPMPLTFWPNKASGCSTAARPKPFVTSWIWPLIDSPHQGPCPGLLDNFLASSIAPDGRLSNLVNVGNTYAGANLTWAVDPALLDNVTTMRAPYRVGHSVRCTANKMHPADKQASKWLSSLTTATAGQQVFVTPYADVDLAGLAQFGRNTDLSRSFSDGEKLASKVLHRARKTSPLPAGPKQLSAVAWPADGRANTALLENLGAMKVGTVILGMPPQSSQLSYTPGAVTSTFDGVGTKLKVLLSANSLTGLLGSPAAKSTQAGSIFSVSQLFMAETAMIVAQQPANQRPILITPPRRWDPSVDLASFLLSDTIKAPWLRTATLNQLAAQKQEHAFKSVVRPYPKAKPAGELLGNVGALDNRVALLRSILTTDDPRLNRAVFGIESSRWTGSGIPAAKARLTKLARYVNNQFSGLSIGGGLKNVLHVTLGGKVGTVNVSIHNFLRYPVRVGLHVTSDNALVTATQHNSHELYLVQAQSSATVQLSVSAAQTGQANVKLTLRSRNGKPLPTSLIKPLTLKLSATNLGTVALVIFAAALAVFVIASAAQALRRGRPDDGDPAQATEPASSSPGGAAAAEGSGGSSPRASTAAEAAPEAGGTGSGAVDGERNQDPPAAPDRPDNVFGDRSELSPAGPNPLGHRPTEETR